MGKSLTDQMDLLRRRIINLQEVASLQSVADLLQAGVEARAIVDCFSRSLMEIGRMYQEGKYYMTGLVLAGEIMRQAMDVLMPHLAKNKSEEKKGLVIIGTIEGDIHELGKNMAGYFLKTDGFEVIDLGVDVAPRVFLKEILQREPDAVGVSLLLTRCMEPLKRLVNLLNETYHEGQAPPLFVGCGFLTPPPGSEAMFQLSEQERQWLGVKHVVTDAYDTLRLCQELTRHKRASL